MKSLFEFHFFQNAFVMSLMLCILFGLLSFFVVTRKMSFLGAGIAHTAFGGVALGIFLDIHPFYTSLFFCLVSAFLIRQLVKYGRITYDTGIGIFFSFSMALGAILISLKKAYTFDLQGYLFGNILGIHTEDLYLTLGAMAVFIPFLIVFFHRLLFITFEEKVALISGVRTELLDGILFFFFVLIIVISIKIVGIILVSALVVLPASFGLLFSKNYRAVILFSIVFNVVCMLGGLFLSCYLDLPAGATMVVLGTVIYCTGAAVKRISAGRGS